ncbi:4Fe-4S dicluster domain-containing protein [Candidatus Woesearchaeota archaeon]|nr:4Fe-4S dicluster domain-containing protein [Candidatus Woesearchaeota archaeon]
MKKLLKKEDLGRFFRQLSSTNEMIAPVKNKSIHNFEIAVSFEQVDLDFHNTAYPPKRFFLPKEQELFSYQANKIKENIDTKPRALFCVRPCDVHALLALDRIFLDEHQDPYYKSRRDNTLIIVLRCTEAGENCFCGSFDTHDLDTGYDLLLTPVAEGYVVDIGTKAGEKLTYSPIFKDTIIEPKIQLFFKKKLEDSKITSLRSYFDAEVWLQESKKCLSCGACTITCPTCGCFFVRDEPKVDLKRGVRYRYCASCQLKNFTRVAGDIYFRESRDRRLKHRIFHQLVYYKEKFDKQMCVGCGRCTTNCPTSIDMVKIVNELK